MSQYNTPPDLNDTFKDIRTRLRSLENAGSSWVPLILGSSVAAVPGYAVPSARREVDTVRLKGSFTATGSLTSGATLATLPAILTPEVTVAVGGCYWTTSAFAPIALQTSSSGTLSVVLALTSGQQIFLDGVTFPLT